MYTNGIKLIYKWGSTLEEEFKPIKTMIAHFELIHVNMTKTISIITEYAAAWW